jgi:glycosyltransferase involved in cell wall biosynthesis
VGIERAGVLGEILVADNGSEDNSVSIAEKLGVRVVHVKKRGYGNTLRAGIQAASGKWIVMGDADESYDFSETDCFVRKFHEGFELVIGCRLPKGGGKVMPGAMPFLHRWLGNSLFSQMARHMFSAPIHDVNCGLRGFTRELYDRLELQCEGMEFALEMIIKASLHGRGLPRSPSPSMPMDAGRTHRICGLFVMAGEPCDFFSYSARDGSFSSQALSSLSLE